MALHERKFQGYFIRWQMLEDESELNKTEEMELFQAAQTLIEEVEHAEGDIVFMWHGKPRHTSVKPTVTSANGSDLSSKSWTVEMHHDNFRPFELAALMIKIDPTIEAESLV